MPLVVKTKKHILGPKQEAVFERLAQGMSYAEIAADLHRDEETVKSHAKIIRQTFEAKSVIEAIAKAVAWGIITIKEVGGKGLFAIFLTVSAGFLDDQNIYRTNAKTRVERRHEA